MSETDKYEVIVANLPTRLGFKGEDARTAAYLREHFVTRDEYDECYDAYSRLQIRGSSWVGNLESVTAERDRLRAACVRIVEYHNEYEGESHSLVGDYYAGIARQALN